MLLPGNILTLPLAVLIAFSNESRWSDGEPEEAAPRTPSPFQPAGRWSTASWGECSNPCGVGEEQRLVSCVLEDATGTLFVVADGFCAPSKPTTAMPCYQYRNECVNSWAAGDWGQCSAKCGGGQRSRLVECHAARPEAEPGAATTAPVTLADAQCVPQLRPAERRECNLQPCPDGRRAVLRIDGRKPRRIRLFSKITLRCPFQVFRTPANEHSKRKYAWSKDGLRLPLHEDKYTQTDSRGELRIKGADAGDSGVYTCASLTANPQGKAENITVLVERMAGERAPTAPPLLEEDVDDSPEVVEEHDGDEPVANHTSEEDKLSTAATSVSEAPADATPSAAEGPSATTADAVSTQAPTAAPVVTEAPPAAAQLRRRQRDLDDADAEADVDASSPVGVAVVAARYDATPFSNCSAACGAYGMRHRAVRCVDNETGKQLPLPQCEDLGPPPPPQEPCNRVDCPPEWKWPSWAGIKCSRTCGGGARWRQAYCSQRLATEADDGSSEVVLPPERCADLGPGEERRECHRNACLLAVREGELLRLDCRAANATWKLKGAGGAAALNLANADKYLADDDAGTLYVFTAAPTDAGLYLCEGDEGDGVVATHRYEVVVRPATQPRPRNEDGDDLFVRVWGTTTTSTTAASTDGTEDGAEEATEEAAEDDDTTASPESEAGDDSPGESTAEPTRPPIPWDQLLNPAAPSRGNMLTIFT